MTEVPGPAPTRSSASRGFRGGVVTLAGSAGSLAIQIVALVVLSRLLTPGDFGIVAMAAVFIALASLLRDFGLPTVGLQLRTLSHQQASNLFWMNLGVAILAAIALVGCTPFLMQLYSEPRLAYVVPALALVVLLGGAGSQIQVQLAREMRFGLLAVSDIVSQLVGLVLAIVLASSGAGYWALIAQSVLAAAMSLTVRWIAARWRPLAFRRGFGARDMARTGAHYGAAQLLTFAQSNVDTLVIGAHLGATQLGYYSRAYQSLTAPAGRLLDPLTQVVISTLNRVQSEGGEPSRALRRIAFLLGFGLTTVFAISAGVAPLLLPLLLGDQWGPAIPVFQILAIGGSFTVLNHISYWLFITYERSRDLLHYNLVSKPLAVLLMICGVQFGITGVAWAYVIAVALSWPLNLVWLRRSADIHTAPFAATGLRVLGGGVLTALAAAWVSTTLSGAGSGTAVALGVGVLSGLVTATLVALLFPASRADARAWLASGRAAMRGSGV